MSGCRCEIGVRGTYFYICNELVQKDMYRFSDGDGILCAKDNRFKKVLGSAVKFKTDEDDFLIKGHTGLYFSPPKEENKKAIMFSLGFKHEGMTEINIPDSGFIVLVVVSNSEHYIYNGNLELVSGKTDKPISVIEVIEEPPVNISPEVIFVEPKPLPSVVLEAKKEEIVLEEIKQPE
tara:strand:- start:34025 stop:34558 length:534 start_codon:yes stop_codon:yes gene_type:complete